METLPVPDTSRDDLSSAERLERLGSQVRELIVRLEAAEQQFASWIDRVDPRYRDSARNLIHYVSSRHIDLRPLQEELARWGLSSLGRMEAHVMETLVAVSGVLDRLASDEGRPLQPVYFSTHRDLLRKRTNDLFGEAPVGRNGRIMVTLPGEAAEDAELVHDLVKAGTDCVRINCAKDDEGFWSRMVEMVRKAERETGRPCRILMDLAGAKPRTGPLEPGPQVAKWKPVRDVTGKVIEPARVVFAAPDASPAFSSEADLEADLIVRVDPDWLARAAAGDTIRLRDARSKKRKLRVVEKTEGGVLAESEQTGYVTSGTRVTLKPRGGRGRMTTLQDIPPVEMPIVLQRGDELVLESGTAPGAPAVYDDDRNVVAPAHITCTTPEVFSDLRVGEPVRFDDGKIEGVVEGVDDDEVLVRITLAREDGSKLRADKGINFPESDLKSHGLTPKDYRDLEFVVQHADMVGLSFTESADSIRGLQDALDETGKAIGIMLKIETQRGFRQLPLLMLEAMKAYPFGVMIARGDLAVECGWERTAEVQEEILWMCEAAHVPVVWATQVLEGLTKSGIPSRAEITDAAMAERAECVMLNKGPYILNAIRSLDDVLKRMAGHQAKKTALLRYLRLTDIMMVDAGF